jgi:hypothetical protein
MVVIIQPTGCGAVDYLIARIKTGEPKFLPQKFRLRLIVRESG